MINRVEIDRMMQECDEKYNENDVYREKVDEKKMSSWEQFEHKIDPDPSHHKGEPYWFDSGKRSIISNDFKEILCDDTLILDHNPVFAAWEYRHFIHKQYRDMKAEKVTVPEDCMEFDNKFDYIWRIFLVQIIGWIGNLTAVAMYLTDKIFPAIAGIIVIVNLVSGGKYGYSFWQCVAFSVIYYLACEAILNFVIAPVLRYTSPKEREWYLCMKGWNWRKGKPSPDRIVDYSTILKFKDFVEAYSTPSNSAK